MTSKCVCDWDRLPLILDVETTTTILCCSRQLLVRMILNGEIQARKVGREWRIPKEAIKQFFEVN